jgi:hypothetical protein
MKETIAVGCLTARLGLLDAARAEIQWHWRMQSRAAVVIAVVVAGGRG